MAITKRLMRGVTPTQVFDVLRNGKTFEHWVVGARTIRDVDPGWPSEGTRLHYTVGYGPLRKDDVTTCRSYEPDALLDLEAYAWPAGTASIVLRCAPGEEGVLVSIDEKPVRGPAKHLHNPVADLLVKLRNVETLRRLEQQARLR